ncbi:MAG: hybrid sensor histidine kinase/response regulator [Microcystis viridis Mv_BB_P_19951000_S69]|uniref:histidine kinase n=1 Tax=Microcystis viridis Mv_BB_P_19951000_S68D TaxID=2486270 RepID=A0A552H6G6_MICVR|nr:MAG: hybrid sensor histidine kinase/response regulator [Microcystis viridis Mv_BB_P_19951000_S68D]TRU68184.1 MAG: hybrid sensor histidine kinase/response regulator [Microcystis viridis Mv_BB_P_19951000_S68]TRU79278.1 MAG: hybrid sensor histidine kinase/response regulator [Microcystis viridis Mv_BB_P_19951000_S69]TRU84486.1 MAG: hybrid sensor histidine kinase/response regulator [Microcystis viridis Mv_BB_P_19951000_S69D]
MTQLTPRPSVLIVDDLPNNVRLLSIMLTEKGYQVRKAINGQMALNTVRSLIPDLILLDINMPDLNGYQVCEQLKADEKTREIPVIFISALDDVLDKVKAFQVGGVDYISKPFQGEEVMARIENQLTICRQKKQLQNEIKERQKAEETLEIYLHAVSHDLRNPVIGMSMILNNLIKNSQGETKEVSLKILQQMANSCDRQLTLIDSLVETRQNDLWGVSLELKPLSLYEIGQQISQEWELRLKENQATLINNFSPNLPLVNADAHHLWRVFENLLANALKHNPQGIIITLSARLQGNYLWCSIADNGVGISETQRKQLFDRYQRGNNNNQISLGLGLYLCRQIIHAHGGEIGIMNNDEKGSQFWFTLPY